MAKLVAAFPRVIWIRACTWKFEEFCRLCFVVCIGVGRGGGGGGLHHILKKTRKKRKIKPIGDRQYQALAQVYQFINEALLGVFRVSDMWVKN